MSATATVTRTFSDAHRLYVKSLYRRYLVNTLNWAVRRDLWREKALEVRAEFERHRNVRDPRALARILEEAEAKLAAKLHPDPYITAAFPGGTKWERNLPPPPNAFTQYSEDNHPAEGAIEELDELPESWKSANLSPEQLAALKTLAKITEPAVARYRERSEAIAAEREGLYREP